MTLKAAIVGSSDYYDFFKEQQPSWDWQVPSETIDDFYDNLDSGQISSDDTSMIIVDPDLYDSTGADSSFEEFLASMSPYALVAVLQFDDDEDTTPKDEIETKVAQYTNDDESSRIYWLEASNILQHLDSITEDFVNDKSSPKDVVAKFVKELDLGQQQSDSADSAGSTDSFDFDNDGLDNIVQSEDSDDSGFGGKKAQKPTFTNTLKQKGTVIAVTSAKGGSGKSTVAFALANEIGLSTRKAVKQGKLKQPLKVCLIDGDVYDGQLCYVLGVSRPTMINIAQEANINQETVRKNLVTNDMIQQKKQKNGTYITFDALLAPKSPRYVEDTPPDMWQSVIDILTTMYDIVIIDTSILYFLDPIVYGVFYPSADKILYVTDLDLKSILDTVKWIQNVCAPESAGGFNIPIEKVGIVVNKSMSNVGMGGRKIASILAFATQQIYEYIDKSVKPEDMPVPQVLTCIPSYPKLVTVAVNHQQLGSIISEPHIEAAFFILAQAVVQPEIATRLVHAANQPPQVAPNVQ